ncbi:hypothetical protein GQ55_8G035800 [Panicum hallii var. hallii]|uniref:F-box domain-containing protein n=1 Tax=Panicum hallii var. hallii TaxID=1504633 RepID=A0A2T7CKC6_9POAL|nr:hypothetical protein GQ55_8G035800 [Panicum hallii var. hallii]
MYAHLTPIGVASFPAADRITDWLGKPRSSPWSELPVDLGSLILRLLPCHIDRLRFRSVCRQWRLVERQQRPHLPPALPLIWLGGHAFLSPAGGELRRFRTDDVDVLRRMFPSCHGSFDGWLAPVPAVRRGLQVLPPPSRSTGPAPLHGRLVRRTAVHRGKLYALNNEDGLFVHEVSAAAAAAVPKASRVVEHAITPQPPAVANPRGLLLMRRYLVVSCAGKLLLVKWMVPSRRDPDNSRSAASSSNATDRVVLKVFEADLEKGRWTEVNSLDNGEALFVGGGCSKAVRLTGNDRRFRENCVYVLGHDFFGYCYKAMPSYGSYDLRSGTISEVGLLGAECRLYGLSGVWNGSFHRSKLKIGNGMHTCMILIEQRF